MQEDHKNNREMYLEEIMAHQEKSCEYWAAGALFLLHPVWLNNLEILKVVKMKDSYI